MENASERLIEYIQRGLEELASNSTLFPAGWKLEPSDRLVHQGRDKHAF